MNLHVYSVFVHVGTCDDIIKLFIVRINARFKPQILGYNIIIIAKSQRFDVGSSFAQPYMLIDIVIPTSLPIE